MSPNTLTNQARTSGDASTMRSLIRPKASSPKAPPIRHARALSPRSVMFEFDEYESSLPDVENFPHLQQPYHTDFTYHGCVPPTDTNSKEKDHETHQRTHSMSNKDQNSSRCNKRKLVCSTLAPRVSLNLRHRQVSHETVEWLSGGNSSDHCGTAHILSKRKYEWECHQACSSESSSQLATREFESTVSTRTNDDSTLSSQEPPLVEELWLGPVFESSHTLLSSISNLPESVHHLDLDLRNALHVLPDAMPLLFSKLNLRRLGLRVFGDAGAIELSKWMNQNPNLEYLDLHGNRIGSLGAREIVDAISCGDDERRNNTTMNLVHLNLSCNCILQGDMFEHLLATNSSIETLDLGFNWLGNKEVSDLCMGLRNNNTLRELNLFGCHRISFLGMQAILDCLQNYNTSLYKIKLEAFDENCGKLIDEINYWLKLNRAGRYLVKLSLPSSIRSTPEDEHDDTNKSSDSKQSRIPVGVWPLALERTKMDPDSLFYLIRQGLSQTVEITR